MMKGKIPNHCQSVYLKFLKRVQEKIKEWKECKLLAILGKSLQTHFSGKVSSSS